MRAKLLLIPAVVVLVALALGLSSWALTNRDRASRWESRDAAARAALEENRLKLADASEKLETTREELATSAAASAAAGDTKALTDGLARAARGAADSLSRCADLLIDLVYSLGSPAAQDLAAQADAVCGEAMERAAGFEVAAGSLGS